LNNPTHTLRGLWLISRPLNVSFIILTVVLGSYLAGWQGTPWSSLLAGAALAALSVMGYILNDLVDLKIDMVNRPRRPLPSALVTTHAAVIYGFIMALLGMSLGCLLNLHYELFMTVVLLFIIIYDLVTKRMGVPGNINVALLTSSALLAGPIAMGLDITPLWAPLALAFLLNLAREIMKDTEDMPGDKQANIHTLPLAVGSDAALTISACISIVTLPIAGLYGLVNNWGWLFWAALVLGLAIPLFFALKPIMYHRNQTTAAVSQRILKLAMLGGLLTFYLGRMVYANG